MPLWRGKSSSKEAKKKTSDETILDTLRRKFRSPFDGKLDSSTGGSRRHCRDATSERGSLSRAESRSSSPSKESKHVARCQSFAERPLAQPLPLPGLHLANVRRTDSGISISSKRRLEKSSKSLFRPLSKPSCIRSRADPSELDNDLTTASMSSESSVESDDLTESRLRSPQTSDLGIGPRSAAGSPSSVLPKDHSPKVIKNDLREAQPSGNTPSGNQNSVTSTRRRPLGNHVATLQNPSHSAFYNAPESSTSSPSRSPMGASNTEQAMNAAFWASKPYPDVTLLGSGQCSSPGSGHNSGHNSMGGEMSGQLFWQPSRGSPEYSPIPSPRMTSPGPSSRVQSGVVTPIHPRAGGLATETHASWADDAKQQRHRLPLPPVSIPIPGPFYHGNSAVTSPSVPRCPARGENPPSPGSRWKKGRLLGRGTFGHVYLGFNSETGEMCAMKEVTLFSDDPKSKESAKQLGQEIALLSRLRHPNIVQYYGSETVGDRLYIYLEFVSGGSIYKLLQEYEQLGELAIRSYTQQILSGLAYLHGKDTVHRDIKGANILVDPSGRVKLADFGMAKHISGQSCLLSFKGSPYWMAPEVIKNSSGCNLAAVDIWSLGCTVIEMATTKPPWSQYEGVPAMFKIGNSKELPTIPNHLSEDGKEFVRLCLQRNPSNRPSAIQLLEHPFVKNAAPLDRPVLAHEPIDAPTSISNGMRTLGIRLERDLSGSESDRLTVHSSRVSPTRPRSSEYQIPRNISCPVSPIGSPLLYPKSPQHLNGMMSPSPISSLPPLSGSSTPLTGGNATIPLYHSLPSAYMQEGFEILSKSHGVFHNGTCYHDPSPNILRRIQSGPPPPRVLASLTRTGNEVRGKQVGRPCQNNLSNGQSVLADRVSQQLLREHVKVNPSLEFSPRSTLPSHTTGFNRYH